MSANRARLSLDISHEFKAKLDELLVKSDASTYTEMIKEAIWLYGIVHKEKSKAVYLKVHHLDGCNEEWRIL